MPNQFGPTFIQQLAFPGPTVTYTPTLIQGATNDITKTVNLANYWLIGKLLICFVDLSITGAGTVGASILVTLPTAMASRVGMVLGGGEYFDSGINTYPFRVVQANTTSVQFYRVDTTGNTAIGGDPSIATANGDALKFFYIGETA